MLASHKMAKPMGGGMGMSRFTGHEARMTLLKHPQKFLWLGGHDRSLLLAVIELLNVGMSSQKTLS